MSILTAAPLKVWPPASNSVTVTSGSTAGAMGEWVEVIPTNLIASPIFIAGICAELYVPGLTNGGTTEVQFGTGSEGNETAISAPLVVVASAGNLTLEIQMFQVPIGNISSGARLSMRTRTTSGNVPYNFSLMYYNDIDPDFSMLAPYTYAPYSNGGDMNGASVVPNASAWSDSGWVEWIHELGAHSALLGVGVNFPSSAYNGVEYEIDLGSGIGGSEVALTTLRGTFSNIGVQGFMDLWLPAMYPINEDTRISFRLRKSGTSVVPLRVHLIYIYNIPTEEIIVTSLELICDVGQFIINGSGFTDTMTIAVQGPSGILAFTVISISPTQIILAIDNLVTGAYCVDLTA